MKIAFLLLILLISLTVSAQNISGKWFGKLSQDPGGYRNLYDFELDLIVDSGITGSSYAYIPYTIEARIGLTGYIDGDSIRLRESKYSIEDEMIPAGWVMCIKNLHLNYFKLDDKEFLRGRWSGVDKEEGYSCIPGLIILARNEEDVNQFLMKAKGTSKSYSRRTAGLIPSANSSAPDFNKDFKNTPVKKLREIVVDNSNLKLILNDYDKIDDDTVSVFLNRDALVEKIKVDKSPYIISFNIDQTLSLNELLMYAENEGAIPPNTSEMILIDGIKTHKIVIDSEKYRSAAVYLKLRPVDFLNKQSKTKKPLRKSKG
jgi:hypothetical protein